MRHAAILRVVDGQMPRARLSICFGFCIHLGYLLHDSSVANEFSLNNEFSNGSIFIKKAPEGAFRGSIGLRL